jgi:hypothetical protein
MNTGKVSGSVNETLVLVNDINNGCELSSIGSKVDEDYTSNFYVTLENHFISVVMKRK